MLVDAVDRASAVVVRQRARLDHAEHLPGVVVPPGGAARGDGDLLGDVVLAVERRVRERDRLHPVTRRGRRRTRSRQHDAERDRAKPPQCLHAEQTVTAQSRARRPTRDRWLHNVSHGVCGMAHRGGRVLRGPGGRQLQGLLAGPQGGLRPLRARRRWRSCWPNWPTSSAPARSSGPTATSGSAPTRRRTRPTARRPIGVGIRVVLGRGSVGGRRAVHARPEGAGALPRGRRQGEVRRRARRDRRRPAQGRLRDDGPRRAQDRAQGISEGPSADRPAPPQGHRDDEDLAGRRVAGHQEGQRPGGRPPCAPGCRSTTGWPVTSAEPRPVPATDDDR